MPFPDQPPLPQRLPIAFQEADGLQRSALFALGLILLLIGLFIQIVAQSYLQRAATASRGIMKKEIVLAKARQPYLPFFIAGGTAGTTAMLVIVAMSSVLEANRSAWDFSSIPRNHTECLTEESPTQCWVRS